MNKKVPSAKCQVPRNSWHGLYLVTRSPRRSWAKPGPSSLVPRHAFTLVEVLVVMALMGLIVLALMRVFDGTQTAFRSGITQTDVLESGRAVTDLIKGDLEVMTPSFGYGTINGFGNTNGVWAVNFCVTNNFHVAGYAPLYQALPAVIDSTTQRTNVLESFFILSRGNLNGSDRWIGVGYSVMGINLQNDLYPLYRFTTNYPVMTVDPARLFTNDFYNFLFSPANYGSHLMDGVVHLRVYAYNNSGQLINTSSYFDGTNVLFQQLDPLMVPDEWGCTFYSNKVPASVEVELGVLEDRTLQRAESLSGSYLAQTNYLAGHAGQVHIFRQRAWIRNMDPAAYK
jgi:prepilin-type N-terminal cleavage/methylation domain-containing protein